MNNASEIAGRILVGFLIGTVLLVPFWLLGVETNFWHGLVAGFIGGLIVRLVRGPFDATY